MRTGLQHPRTLTFLGTGFLMILAALALSATVVHYQAGRVSTQTRQIMDNGVPSVIAAARLKEIIPGFRLPHPAHSPDPGDRPRFEAAAQHFKTILAGEQQARIFFPGEQATLTEVDAAFQRVVADERPLFDRPAQSPQLSARLNREIDHLAAACERFDQVNQRGMTDAQAILSHVAERERQALFWGFAGSIAIALGWALLLTRAIARPLLRLKHDLGALSEAQPLAGTRTSGLVPREIRELDETFQEATLRLQAVTAQREVARFELQAALQREHHLNLDLTAVNASLDQQVRAKTAALEEANVRLAGLVDELRQRDRSKSTFLAKVSHELRTPLAVIKGAAATVARLRAKLEADAVEQLLGNVVEEADHLSGLVDDLLDAARMDAGTFRIAPEPDVALVPLIESVVGGLSALFDDQEVTIRCDLPTALPAVTADPERVRQVLRNLLENAARFAPGGSVVQVVARVLAADVRPARIEIAVTDEGPGIPDALRGAIFTAFVQGSGAAQSRGGAGLGLAIARQLVEAHGGEIGVDAGPRGGSVFRFWLPLPALQPVTK